MVGLLVKGEEQENGTDRKEPAERGGFRGAASRHREGVKATVLVERKQKDWMKIESEK